MIRLALCATLAAGALFAFAAPSAQSQDEIIAPPFGAISNEPVVVYQVSGGTLTGTQFLSLVIYDSGFASVAINNQAVFPVPGTTIDVQTKSVGPAAVQRLMRSLTTAGAFELPDQPLAVSDVPLNTLTVLDGGADAKAHTFSYWLTSGDYAPIGAALDKFLSTNFPGVGSSS